MGAQSEDGDRAFAFDVEFAERLAIEGRGNVLEDLLGDDNASRRNPMSDGRDLKYGWKKSQL